MSTSTPTPSDSTPIYCGADQQGNLGSGRPYHTRECHHVESATSLQTVTEDEINRYNLRECNACSTIRSEEDLGL